MGKNKSLSYQLSSALSEINLQDKEKRIEVYNNENNTSYEEVGKREFKQSGTSKNYIFSRTTAEVITEKSINFTTFLKENYNIKMVRDITPEMCKNYLDSKTGCSIKTINAYKNMLDKVSYACTQKYKMTGFYSDEVKYYKVADTYKTDSSRLYTNEQIEKIINTESKYQNVFKIMAYVGLRVSETNISVKDINISEHRFATTTKDGKIDTYMSIHIFGKGGKESFRPILPQFRPFIEEIIKGKAPNEKVFDLPKSHKEIRQAVSYEMRKITTELGLPISSKNHDFRKYSAQIQLDYFINQRGWSKEKAEKFIISRSLSHGESRNDLKAIYLYS